jgi:hypothetical protein
MAPYFEKNIELFEVLIVMLDKARAASQAAINDIQGTFDNIEWKIVGLCAINAVEVVAVTKLVKATAVVCSAGAFATQCAYVGLTAKEILTYNLRNTEIANAVLTVTEYTIQMSSEILIEDKPKWYHWVPIVGPTCASYALGEKIASAPDTIELLGNQQLEIMKLWLEVKKQIKQSEELLEEVTRKRDEACNGQP